MTGDGGRLAPGCKGAGAPIRGDPHLAAKRQAVEGAVREAPWAATPTVKILVGQGNITVLLAGAGEERLAQPSTVHCDVR